MKWMELHSTRNFCTLIRVNVYHSDALTPAQEINLQLAQNTKSPPPYIALSIPSYHFCLWASTDTSSRVELTQTRNFQNRTSIGDLQEVRIPTYYLNVNMKPTNLILIFSPSHPHVHPNALCRTQW